jgi:hypothetical protein
MLHKYPRAFGPRHAKREVPAISLPEVQRIEARTAQVLVEALSPRGVLRHSTTFSGASIMHDMYQSRVSVL